MNYEQFSTYISRFNNEDAGTFDTYLAADVTVQNGRMHYSGVQGMKDHYAKIWKSMREILSVQRFVSDGETMAVELHTHFDVRKDEKDSPFGEIKKGEMFDYSGVVLYRVKDGKITDIKVSYLDFVKTALDGTQTSLGIVH
ncbi:MAG: nuclear transport factor 2 family protein [Steroidobacteraceae bacterium]